MSYFQSVYRFRLPTTDWLQEWLVERSSFVAVLTSDSNFNVSWVFQGSSRIFNHVFDRFEMIWICWNDATHRGFGEVNQQVGRIRLWGTYSDWCKKNQILSWFGLKPCQHDICNLKIFWQLRNLRNPESTSSPFRTSRKIFDSFDLHPRWNSHLDYRAVKSAIAGQDESLVDNLQSWFTIAMFYGGHRWGGVLLGAGFTQGAVHDKQPHWWLDASWALWPSWSEPALVHAWKSHRQLRIWGVFGAGWRQPCPFEWMLWSEKWKMAIQLFER